MSHGSVRRLRRTWRTENKFPASSFYIICHWTNLIPKATGSFIQVEEISNVQCEWIKNITRLNVNLCVVLTVLTYLLTPWSRVLLQKLTSSAARQEVPRIFGTRKFLTVLTSARHLSLSWANSIQSPQSPPTFWRSILILSSHLYLGLPNGFLSLRFHNTD
jgi:hypothetical protein